jgi:O-antigen/teichoic acid export membrane protein
MLTSYIAAGIFGTYTVFRLSSKQTRARLKLPDKKELKKAFRFSIPVAANNTLTNGVISFATMFLGFFVAANVLGNFGIALRVGDVIAMSYGTIATTLLPTLSISASRSVRGSKKRGLGEVYNKVLLYSLAVTIPVIAYLGVFAKPLIYLLITRTFTDAPMYLALITLGTIISLVGVYTANLFVAVGKTMKLFHYMLIVTLVQLVVLVLLAPIVGVVGVIIALFFIGSILTDYLLLRCSRIHLGIRLDYNKLLRVFASNAVLAIVLALGLAINGFVAELVYGVLAIIVAYPILLVLLKAIEIDDIRILDGSTKGLPALHSFATPFINYFKFLMRYVQ